MFYDPLIPDGATGCPARPAKGSTNLE